MLANPADKAYNGREHPAVHAAGGDQHRQQAPDGLPQQQHRGRCASGSAAQPREHCRRRRQPVGSRAVNVAVVTTLNVLHKPKCGETHTGMFISMFTRVFA